MIYAIFIPILMSAISRQIFIYFNSILFLNLELVFLPAFIKKLCLDFLALRNALYHFSNASLAE